MKKFTFMISGYENYDPSNYEYMHDEDRLWELSYDVIASSKEEAMNKLLNDSYAKERKIIDEDRVKILRIFGEPENQFTESSYYTYVIVSTKDVRLGVDLVDENIFITKKLFTKNKWCSDGNEKISTYIFNDGFAIKEINRSASGWSESETLLIDNSNNNCFTLYTRGEDTYNSGDKKIYACQSLRFKAISKYENEKALLKRKFEASLLNAKETSRQTFLDREMPFIKVVKRGIVFKFVYISNFINNSGDWDYKTIEKDFEFANLDEALNYESKSWTGSIYDEPMEIVSYYNPILKEHETFGNLNKAREIEILSFLNKHIL